MYDSVLLPLEDIVDADAAQAWFTAGPIVAMAAGGLHVLLTVVDTVRPTYFTPIDGSAKPAVEGTSIRLGRMFPGDIRKRPSMWRVWLGIHLTHGLGIFVFGLLCLVIAMHDFELVERIDVLRPLTIGISAAYFAISLRFFFYGPVLVTAAATACFTIATLLSV
jgi:hypothetical protein